MLPFVRRDDLWRSGLAGAIPFAFFFVIGGCFLFAAARRLFQSTAAACDRRSHSSRSIPTCSTSSPTPMTESMFFGCFCALLYFTVRFRETQSWGSVIGAGVVACLGALTRYDGWFLIPFVGLYFLIAARERRLAVAFHFLSDRQLGPVLLALSQLENERRRPRLLSRPVLRPRHPRQGQLSRQSLLAARLPVSTASTPGIAPVPVSPCSARSAWSRSSRSAPGGRCSSCSCRRPSISTACIPAAPRSSSRSSIPAPITTCATGSRFCRCSPWPRPPWWQPCRGGCASRVAAIAIVIATLPWLIRPHPENWIVFEEGHHNYAGHRELERQVEEYLRPRYVHGAGIVTEFGATTAIYRDLGIPLRETLTGDNGAISGAANSGPNPFPHQEWAVVIAGDYAEKAVQKAGNFTSNRLSK